MNGLTAVVLPGSGSDERFVRRAFAEPLRALGIRLVAPAPRPGPRVVEGYREALDAAAREAAEQGDALLVGGVSLGAHVAARFVAARFVAARSTSGSGAGGGACAGLLLALPAWTGPPAGAPAALAARATAAQVRTGGTAAAVTAARAGAPSWLADELARAWPRYGDGLAASLDAAAGSPAPDDAALARLDVPAGIAALTDDPVHPLGVALTWREHLPRAALVTSRLDALGADPAVLGRAAVLGWLRAGGLPAAAHSGRR